MSLEAEAQKTLPPDRPRAPVRLGGPWEILFRLVALALLGLIATGSVFVMFTFHPIAAAFVVGITILALVAVGARLHAVRLRVDALEAALVNVAQERAPSAAEAGGPSSPGPDT